MHAFLPSVGFSLVQKRSQLQWLLQEVQEHADKEQRVMIDEESTLVYYERSFAPGAGIALIGTAERGGGFSMEYYYPYVNSDVCSTQAECMTEWQSDKEGLNGLCDDYRLGLNLIFHINNLMDFKREIARTGQEPRIQGVCLSGLAVEGKILLPTASPEGVKLLEAKKRESRRMKLLADAREGDQAAIDSLTIEEMNINARINQYIGTQDVYTMVESYIMPCGVECDHYSLLGTITKLEQYANDLSGEKLYVFELSCNGIPIRVMMGQNGLEGAPALGRRFKGDVWLQGMALTQ